MSRILNFALACMLLASPITASEPATQPADVQAELKRLRQEVTVLKRENARLRRSLDRFRGPMPELFRFDFVLPEEKSGDPDRRRWVPFEFNKGTYYLIPLDGRSDAPRLPSTQPAR